MKKQFNIIHLLFPAIVILIVLAGCNPQVVEVEVTRIVETVEEVEVEVEVEVTREVEVVTETVVEEVVIEEETMEEEAMEEEATAADEVLGEQADDVMAEEAAEADVAAPNASPIEAVGSEEDDGSPFTPTNSQKKGGNGDEAEIIIWLTSADESIEEPNARVLANHVDDMMIIHTTRTATFEEKVILARSIILYERRLIDETSGEILEIESETLYLPLSINRWVPIVEQLETVDFPQLMSEPLCDICTPNQYEAISIITTEETLNIEFDNDQDVPDIETLLFLIRDLQSESRVRVRSTLDRFE